METCKRCGHKLTHFNYCSLDSDFDEQLHCDGCDSWLSSDEEQWTAPISEIKRVEFMSKLPNVRTFWRWLYEHTLGRFWRFLLRLVRKLRRK